MLRLGLVFITFVLVACKSSDQKSFKAQSPDGYKEAYVQYIGQGDLEWEKPKFYVGISDTREPKRVLGRIIQLGTSEYEALNSPNRKLAVDWGQGESEGRIVDETTGLLIFENPSEVRRSINEGFIDVRNFERTD